MLNYIQDSSVSSEASTDTSSIIECVSPVKKASVRPKENVSQK